mmetsp:Transcript_28542/g.50708  ORF Transcript_28542/g.50708 Transcript_28542/m.50708 type:complete len:133 (-) Transcript_28542:1038-1436(-)
MSDPSSPLKGGITAQCRFSLRSLLSRLPEKMAGGRFVYNSLWVVRDGIGILLFGLTWGVMLFSNLIITTFCIFPYFEPFTYPSGTLILVVYQLIFLLAGVTHLKCSFTEPGIVPPKSEELHEKNDRVCFDCE